MARIPKKAATLPSLEELCGEYGKAENLQALADKYQIDFQKLYHDLDAVGCRLKRAELYWLKYKYEDKSVVAIADDLGVSHQAVSSALRNAGYTTQRISNPKELKRSGRAFALSDRLRDAINSIGAGRLIEGIALLEKDPTRIRLENIGTEEKSVTREFSLLSDEDVERIERLGESSGVKWGSVLVRNAIEALIEQEGLERYAKPPGWQSKPLPLVLGGPNPVAKSDEPLFQTTYTFPLRVWSRIEQFRIPRGQRNGRDLSWFLREAIDNADMETITDYIVPYPAYLHEPGVTAIASANVRVYERQIESLEGLQMDLDLSPSQLVSAIAWQAVKLKTVPEVTYKRVPKIPDTTMKRWKVLCENNSLIDTAEKFKMEQSELLKSLEQAGLILIKS